MNRLLLLRPISRAVNVQRPVTCYRHLNKSFSNTTCRKFGSPSIKRTENSPPSAEAASSAASVTPPVLEALELGSYPMEVDQQESTKPVENDNIAMTFPELRMPSPLLDPRDMYELPTEDIPYHNRVIIRNLNNELVDLVRHAQYDEAYRLRNHLFENKIHINHHLVYEKAALSGIELGKTGEGLEKFINWFSLVPDRNELPPTLTTQRRYIYSDTRFSLLRCGNPRAYLNYIMVFGNIMAAKGYTLISFLEIARLVVRFGSKELVVQYFNDLEQATTTYYWEQEPHEGGWVLKWFWEVVVKLYMEKGWLDLAFDAVVENDAKFRLSGELGKILLNKLEGRGDRERASVIRVICARDQSANKATSI